MSKCLICWSVSMISLNWLPYLADTHLHAPANTGPTVIVLLSLCQLVARLHEYRTLVLIVPLLLPVLLGIGLETQR